MKPLLKMENCALILDLDYTIFPTNKIDKGVLERFFDTLQIDLQSYYSQKVIDNIVADLWRDSWDVVLEKYDVPKDVFQKSVAVLQGMPIEMEISTYPDYQFVKQLSLPKFLVTTGLTSLQNAKIAALQIENDFDEIVINDRLVASQTKFEIFKELIEKHQLNPEKTIVIGDNPKSEIEAGNKLKLTTIQIVREHIEQGTNAAYYIKSFQELKDILNEIAPSLPNQLLKDY